MTLLVFRSFFQLVGDIEELRAKEYSDTAAGQKKGKSSGEFQPQQSEEFQVREDGVRCGLVSNIPNIVP